MEAAERFAFARGDENTVIAHDPRVSVRSVQRWRRAWSQDGPTALASKDPAPLALLSDELFTLLERELAMGPAAWRSTPRISRKLGGFLLDGRNPEGLADCIARHCDAAQ
ncbi:hypothetical protein [Streptomyces sp. NPDC096142]|uniref:hypothetical protein n=1 Tax=Streptomyces sp. NPDC096142 TaxID=3366077 RepID=UPI00380C98ED